MPLNRAPDRKLVFPVEGVQVDLGKSNDKNIFLKNLNKASSGVYKCQVSVENTFKSVSATKRMEVRERLPAENLVNQNVAGVNSGYFNVGMSSRQQQQRHAVQQQKQQQQATRHQLAASMMSQQQQQHQHQPQPVHSHPNVGCTLKLTGWLHLAALLATLLIVSR